jgi:hypothetical protein
MFGFVVGIIYVGNCVVTSQSLEPPSTARIWYPATRAEQDQILQARSLFGLFTASLPIFVNAQL